MRFHAWKAVALSVILASGLILALAASATAQNPDPGRPPAGNGKAIKDKLQEVVNKTATLGTNLEALCDSACQGTEAGQRFKDKVARFKRTHTKLANAHGRSQEGDFQELVRQKPKRKDQGCDPQVQVCVGDGSYSVTSQPDAEFDEERGKDVVEDLEEVGSEVDQLNEILAGHVAPPPYVPAVTLTNASYFFPTSMRPSPWLSYGAFIASQVAQKASAIADHGCDQTAVALGFGGNAAAACVVVEGVFQLLDYTCQVLNFISQDFTSAETSATYARTKDLFDQMVSTGGDVAAMKFLIENMGQKMLILEANQQIILELLRTPQGQRTGFPTR